MFKTLSILIATVSFSLCGCLKCYETTTFPNCVKSSIENNKNKDSWYVGKVVEYRYQNQTVYAFEPDARVIADGTTTVITANCDTLCTVGGFGGPDVILCNGENFFRNATELRVVWNKYP